ncbi:MAG: alanine racemase, partial [Clostridia bacterium]|nr:alanine racemase [Clostridia bacterium]
MYHVTRAGIDMSAAADNYRAIRAMVDKANKDTDIICVVKADAYGHGAKRFAALYKSLGVKSYAVSNLDEAVDLRKKLGDGEEMILILGYTDPAYAHVLCRYRLTQTVFSLDYAIALSANLEEDLPVHIKVDTGMNRLGFPATEAGAVQVADALAMPHLIPDGIFTHFACADEEDTASTRAQFERFMAMTEALSGIGI